MKELKDRSSQLRQFIKLFPDSRNILSQCSKCAYCQNYFLNTWLECVKFIDVKKVCLSLVLFYMLY